MRVLSRISFFFLLLFIMVGCAPNPQPEISATQAVPQPNLTRTPYIFKTSTPDTASIHSHLLVVEPLITAPDPATPDPIFLVPLPDQDANILAIPTFEIGDVPQADVDETTGEFVFSNIEPGRYVVMVILIGGTQIPARDYDTGNLAIITINASDLGQVIELNALTIP